MSVCCNQDQETRIHQDVSKLRSLRKNVQNIAKVLISLLIILFGAFTIQITFNSDMPMVDNIRFFFQKPVLVGATIWIITLSICILLHIGASKKKRASLVPFRILVGCLQPLFVFNIVLAMGILLASPFMSKFRVKVYIPFVLAIYDMAMSFVLFKMQRTTKNLFDELGRQPSALQLVNVSYNTENEKIYSSVYQPRNDRQVRASAPIIEDDGNCGGSGLHVILPPTSSFYIFVLISIKNIK